LPAAIKSTAVKPAAAKPVKPVKPVAVKPVKPVRVTEEPVPPPVLMERPAAKQAAALKRRMRKVISFETDSDESKSESELDDEPPQKPAFDRRFGGGLSAFQFVFSS
jgi:hypothetical protein